MKDNPGEILLMAGTMSKGKLDYFVTHTLSYIVPIDYLITDSQSTPIIDKIVTVCWLCPEQFL